MNGLRSASAYLFREMMKYSDKQGEITAQMDRQMEAIKASAIKLGISIAVSLATLPAVGARAAALARDNVPEAANLAHKIASLHPLRRNLKNAVDEFKWVKERRDRTEKEIEALEAERTTLGC